MKKCNYFSTLLAGLLMFIGVSISAQDYVNNSQALRRVVEVLDTQNKVNPSSGDVVNSHTLSNVDEINLLKRTYGNALLEPLKDKVPVADALEKASSMFIDSYKGRGQLNLFLDVETFYKRLLRK